MIVKQMGALVGSTTPNQSDSGRNEFRIESA